MPSVQGKGTAAPRLPRGGRGGQRRHPARRPEFQGHRAEKQVNGKETTMPKTDIKVRIIGADGNVFNGKFFVMESIFS